MKSLPRPVARAHRRGALGAALLATGLAVTLAVPASGAFAAPAEPVYPSQEQVDGAEKAVGDAAGQVAALDAAYAAAAARVEAAQEQAAAAAEEYQGAKLVLAQRAATTKAARATADRAKAGAEEANLRVRRYASAVYQQSGSLGDLDAFMSASGPQEVMDRIADMDTIGQARNRTLAAAAASSERAASLTATADRAQAQQQVAADAAQKAKAAADQQQAAANATAVQVQQEQAAMVAQLARLQKTSVALQQQRQAGIKAEAERRARAAAAARAAAEQAAAERAESARAAAAAAERARQEQADRDNRPKAPTRPQPPTRPDTPSQPPAPSNPDPKPTTPTPTTPPPPTSGGVSAVLSYARAQLGKPYLWGGEGPGAFDCSGLTLKAWQQAGVRMSHYTGFQYAETARVPISQLQPGDLVFYGSSGPSSHHVGLYVGGGQMIEAPHSGAVVRYASIYRGDLLPYGGRPG